MFTWLIIAIGLAATSPVGTAQDRALVCRSEPGREAALIRAEVGAGEEFETNAGPFVFRLTPNERLLSEFSGWHIGVFQAGRRDDLARLSPPLRFQRTVDIQGWHFRNADNTGPNDGTVNFPQEQREFIFSPEVGRTIEYRGSGTSAEDVERVKAFGRGKLTILDYQLTPPQRGGSARFLRMKFDVCMSWPSGK